MKTSFVVATVTDREVEAAVKVWSQFGHAGEWTRRKLKLALEAAAKVRAPDGERSAKEKSE